MSKKRQETPNVLSDLLDSKSSKQETSKPENQEASKTKVTYYVADETAVAFDMAHAQMRQYTRGRARKLSKSDLADAMIRMVLEEIEKQGPDSKVLDYL